MSSIETKQIEAQIAAAKETADMATALDRLKSNRDFKKVILQGYFKDEAIRLVQVKGNPDVQHPSSQAAIIRDIDAIGSLFQFLNQIEREGNQAEKTIADGQREIEAITEEELNNG